MTQRSFFPVPIPLFSKLPVAGTTNGFVRLVRLLFLGTWSGFLCSFPPELTCLVMRWKESPKGVLDVRGFMQKTLSPLPLNLPGLHSFPTNWKSFYPWSRSFFSSHVAPFSRNPLLSFSFFAPTRLGFFFLFSLDRSSANDPAQFFSIQNHFPRVGRFFVPAFLSLPFLPLFLLPLSRVSPNSLAPLLFLPQERWNASKWQFLMTRTLSGRFPSSPPSSGLFRTTLPASLPP